MGNMNINSDDLKYGLECCIKYMACVPAEECCDVCPYLGRCGSLEKDALAMIQQLEAEKAELKRERDAAVNDLTESQFCHACKYCEEKEELAAYHDVPAECVNCAYEKSQFLWRGPCEENGGQKEE